ncbi:MAG TPA: metalloregulator ArsR/SmtB family transcription factor [Propionicimonas sp.]|nr:metalloregulator ArsR/SmtB family transcription factor [Propionicimonas sp.]
MTPDAEPTPTGAEPAGRAETPSPDELDHAVEVLRLLADHTRLAILALLHGRELSVTAIAEHLGRPVPGISQHLAKLRTGNLVTSRRDGTTVYYTQPDEHVAALVLNVLQHTEHHLYDRPPHHR